MIIKMPLKTPCAFVRSAFFYPFAFHNELDSDDILLQINKFIRFVSLFFCVFFFTFFLVSYLFNTICLLDCATEGLI